MMPSRPAMPVIHPMFCGESHPEFAEWICTLDPFHTGKHTHGPRTVSWPKTPTEPAIKRAARVDPDTIPEMQLEDRSCYFCGEAAGMLVNGDVPTCGRHSR